MNSFIHYSFETRYPNLLSHDLHSPVKFIYRKVSAFIYFHWNTTAPDSVTFFSDDLTDTSTKPFRNKVEL